MTVLEFPSRMAEAPAASLAAGLSPAQKAAVLMLHLGQEACVPIVSQLSESELEDLSVEIARLDNVSPEVSACVLDEFAALLGDGTAASPRGGIEAARLMLAASIGHDRADEIAERVSHSFVDVPFAFLQHLDHRQVSSFLADEHPQTVALVLSHLSADLASRVLAGMSRETQADVAHRIAVMDRTSPELIRQVEASLERRMASLGVRSDLSTIGGLRPLVDIINRADRATEKDILDGLASLDNELAEQVRSQLFTFDDVALLDDRSIQIIIRQVSVPDLALALKGVSGTVRDKIMSNMSERASAGLLEELDLLGPVRTTAVEEAQAGVVRTVRALEESGEITLSRGDDDAYVA